MRLEKRFCARMVFTAGLAVSAVSVFGLSPVHAQTAGAAPRPGSVRRMSIDEAVATGD